MSTCANIAKPFADEKLANRIMNLVEKAQDEKILGRGVKEVGKLIKKFPGGLVIMAADTAPIDVLSHIPVHAERHKCKYIWIKSRVELGKAAGLPRATGIVYVKPEAEDNRKCEELWSKVTKKVSRTKSE